MKQTQKLISHLRTYLYVAVDFAEIGEMSSCCDHFRKKLSFKLFPVL